jgi:hypothetical protein
MRLLTLLAVPLGLALSGGPLHGYPRVEASADTIARLIRQLGDDEFAKRQEASKALEATGEPALPALRKALKDDDAEIRRRAERLIRAISHAVGKKLLARWEGIWTGDPGVTMTVTGNTFRSAAPGVGSRNGTLTVVEVGEKVVHVDFLVEEGDTKGLTARAILRLDGDTLHYCVTYGPTRPVEFKSGGENFYIPWKRTKK